VLEAYAGRCFHGNLPDLFEPGLAPFFYPRMLDNKKIPDNWFTSALNCDKKCERCGNCERAMNAALS